jgi:cytoskeletal protein RodZ
MAEEFEVGAPLPEESSNRTFIIAAAGIGGLLVLSMICLGVYALVIAPRQQEARIAQLTQVPEENTQTALGLTQTAQAGQATATPQPTDTPQPSATPTATPTEVVVVPTETEITSLSTVAPQTATAAAQATADAAAQAQTPTRTPTATALPATGFADEAGLPTLLLVGAALVAILIVVRRLRVSGG